jgi:hypothetical protein
METGLWRCLLFVQGFESGDLSCQSATFNSGKVQTTDTHWSLLAVLHLANRASSFTLNPNNLGSYLSEVFAAPAVLPDWPTAPISLRPSLGLG